MAETELTAQLLSSSSIIPTYAAANVDGSRWKNTGKEFLHIKNTNAATRDITIVTPRTVDGLAVADVTFTIAITTGDRIVGPFSAETFNQAGGWGRVSFSAVADVTIALFKTP